MRKSGIPDTDHQRFPYVDIARMGHTDFSLWIETDAGERTEWMLDRFPRSEAERLFRHIEPHWRAKRERSTEASRQQLAALRALRQ